MYRQLPILLFVVSMTAGCASNQPSQPLFGGSGYTNGYAGTPGGYSSGGFTPDNGPYQQQANGANNQLAGLNSQLRQLDSDNQNLHAQVAALQQRLQNANSYNDQLKQQLRDQMAQLQQAQRQLQQASSQYQQLARNASGSNSASSPYSNAAYPAPATQTSGAGSQFAGATIRANNGLMQKLQTVQMPGYKAWMDGDVIRIEGPTDRLFVSGSYEINANDAVALTNLANTIRQQFPRQVIGVEAHWDGTPIEPATVSHHQLTATQALAVFDLLVRSGLPNRQVFTMAMGSNRLRYPAGNAANRRIEIVIYPETF
jgi:flagellar motor protein MotB